MKRIVIESLLVFLAFFSINFFVTDSEFSSIYIIKYILISVPQALLIVYLIWIKKPEREANNPQNKILQNNSLSVYGFRSFKLKEIIYTVILFAFIFVISYTIVYFLELLPDSIFKSPEQVLKISVPIPFLLAFSIAVGYKEEIFFRSYLLTGFANAGIRFRFIAIISTCLFALLHAYSGTIGVLIALINGFIFCYAFKKTKNVHVIAIAHTLYNFTVLVLQSG
jgi:hypothetical protein